MRTIGECSITFLSSPNITSSQQEGGGTGGKSPFSLLSEPISPSSILFEPISPSSLKINFCFSPSSLLFPPISPSSQLFLGHFSLLPILFLPPPTSVCDDRLSFDCFLLRLKSKLDILRTIAIKNKSLNKFETAWGPFL